MVRTYNTMQYPWHFERGETGWASNRYAGRKESLFREGKKTLEHLIE